MSLCLSSRQTLKWWKKWHFEMENLSSKSPRSPSCTHQAAAVGPGLFAPSLQRPHSKMGTVGSWGFCKSDRGALPSCNSNLPRALDGSNKHPVTILRYSNRFMWLPQKKKTLNKEEFHEPWSKTQRLPLQGRPAFGIRHYMLQKANAAASSGNRRAQEQPAAALQSRVS